MTFSEKLVSLRKSRGWSQEQLAERLEVSRQAISRWEGGTAMPDAGNLRQLSRLFGVSADYLLNDDYSSDLDIPKVQGMVGMVKEIRSQALFYLLLLEIMWVIILFITTVILQSAFFSVLGMLSFLGAVIGFELGYRRSSRENRAASAPSRKKFYKITAWLGSYFPVRLGMMCLFSGGIGELWFECVTVVVYLACAACLSLGVERLDTTGS